MKYITRITPDIVGKKVSAFIGKTFIEEAMIVVRKDSDARDKGCIFGLAQNIISGEDSETEQKHKYRHVWVFRNNNKYPEGEFTDNVSKITLLSGQHSSYVPFL